MTDKKIIKALESEIHLAEYADSSYADNVSLVLLKNALGLINRQQSEIDRLESIINTDNQMIKSLNKCYEISKTEAIKEFADSFDDELAKLRDTYFERGLKDYSLVCEVIHDYLYRTLKEMVGAIE